MRGTTIIGPIGAGQAVRALRCAVFAAATTVLAAVAHAVSGVMLPPAGVLLVTGAAVGFAAYPLTRRERELPAVLGATVAGQLALHVVLTVAMAGSCAVATMPGMAGGGSVPAGAGAMGCSGGGGWLPMTTAGRSGAVMLAGHLLAAVGLAWWLRRGERALVRLAVLVVGALGPAVRWLTTASWTGDRLPARSAAVPTPIGPPVAAVCHPGLRGAQVWARRGPPAVAA